MFNVTITFPQGPTIMADDQKPVVVKRIAFTDKQAAEIQEAALVLQATNVEVKRSEK